MCLDAFGCFIVLLSEYSGALKLSVLQNVLTHA